MPDLLSIELKAPAGLPLRFLSMDGREEISRPFEYTVLAVARPADVIDFDKLQLAKQAEPPLPGFYCAIGVITYPDPGAKPGLLLYIKPGLHGNLPADIRAYAASNARFPHDSTMNQWFTESQFESYRALGSFIIDEIAKPPAPPKSGAAPAVPNPIADLFAGAADYLA